MPDADLQAARDVVHAAHDLVVTAAGTVGTAIDEQQVVAYDVAHAAADRKSVV